MMSRTLLRALLLGSLVCPAARLTAQDRAPWRLSYFPYLTASPNDGVMGIARAIGFQQAGWGERLTLQQYVAVDAGYSTRGSWLATATWGAPLLAEGWRLMARLEAGHQPHFGVGSAEASLVRDRALGWVDVTRRLSGPLHLALRPAVRHTELGDGSAGVDETDLSLRGALVLDLRDREFEVNRGVLAEVGAIVGTGGGEDRHYSAPYAHLRGWVHPVLPLRLTARVAWRGTTGSPALAPGYEFPGWEGDFTLLGGARSQRGLPIGALPVDGVVLAGAEARFDLLNVGEIGALTVLGFVDGGKPLRSGSHAVSPDWIWSAGGGVALRVLRAATLTVTAARADHDTRWYVSSGWSW
jgi:hypothetical protein